MRFLILLLICSISTITFAQKAKDHAVIIKELAEKIQEASLAKTPAHLAVVTFVPTQGNASAVNTYGDYLTESIIGKLSENPAKFKLYERKRLDAILKENELMLSGMMKPSEALKIGQLLSIDALFSGTYTKLKSYIDVSGRLIDVTTGEILMSYSGRIKLTKNLKTLFPEAIDTPLKTTTLITDQSTSSNQTQSTHVDRTEICKQRTEAFTVKLNDLSSSDKIEMLVKEAIKTPFENTCGRLHYHMINAFMRYNIMHTEYKLFLLQTLDTISYPSADDRAYSILSYCAKDLSIDDEEWRTGFNAVKRVGDYSLSTYLNFLLTKNTEDNSDINQKRIDQYFDHLKNNKIGLPRPVDYNKGFFEMIEGLNKNQSLRLYAYENYADRLVTEKELSVSLHFMYLKRMYDDEKDASTKSKIAGWAADYFNNHVYKKTPTQLYEFAFQFELEPNPDKVHYITQRNNDKLINYPQHDLAILIEKCGDKFSEYATQTEYTSERESRINFCVNHGIPVPGVIPTIEESELVLKGNDVEEQLRVIKLLSLMGEKARPLENTLIKLLNKKSLEEKEKLQEIQSIAVQILGTLKTTDQKAIQYMISKLMSYNYKESDSAREALATIGKPAVSSLINRLISSTNQEGGLQYQLVVILGKIGKDAGAAEASLKSLLNKTTNSDIRYAIEATLQEINNE